MKQNIPARTSLISSKCVHRTKVFSLHEERFRLGPPVNQTIKRQLINHPGAVVILPMIGPEHILLLRQYRYSVRKKIWEIPAGTLYPGENPLVCGKRELEEETGYKAKRWTFLTHIYPAPGISNERMHLYSAAKLVKGKSHPDADEILQPRMVKINKALDMIRNRCIVDAKTIIAILWYCHLPSKS